MKKLDKKNVSSDVSIIYDQAEGVNSTCMYANNLNIKKSIR